MLCLGDMVFDFVELALQVNLRSKFSSISRLFFITGEHDALSNSSMLHHRIELLRIK